MTNPQTATAPETDEDVGILLAQVENSFWLLEGEEHLYAMLSGKEDYPTPVRCLRFNTLFDLNMLLPEGESSGTLWGVRPSVIDRLVRNDELITLQAPEMD